MDDKKKLGDIGEKIAAYLYDADLSDDPFDSKKDMRIRATRKLLEIKVQNRWIRYDAYGDVFTIEDNRQINKKKCLSVDVLTFIEYDHSDYIRIWEVTDRNNYKILDTVNGKKLAFPINKMKLAYQFKHAELSLVMKKLSQAKDFQKYKNSVQQDIFMV